MTDEVQYLFNSEGFWIAFRLGKNLFNTESAWIGWFPWDSDEAVDIHGEYLGTIYDEKRLYRFTNRRDRSEIETPAYPEHPGYPGHPDRIGYEQHPPCAADIWFSVNI